MGFSLKKVVKSVTKPIKKVTSVATSAFAGFAGGGGVGGLAGLVKGVVANTKTSKAASTTLRSVGTDVAIGAATNIAAGAVAGGAKFLPGLFSRFGGQGVLTETGQVIPGIGEVASYNPNGGGFFSAFKTGLNKTLAFGQSGGIAGNAGNIFSRLGSLAGKGFDAVKAADIFNKGGNTVFGTNESPESITRDQDAVGGANGTFASLRKVPAIGSRLSSLYERIRNNGVSTEAVDDLRSIISGQNNPPSNITVNSGESGPAPMNLPLLAGIGILAFMFLKKK